MRDGPGHGEVDEGIEFDHLMLLENGSEIARALTDQAEFCTHHTIYAYLI